MSKTSAGDWGGWVNSWPNRRGILKNLRQAWPNTHPLPSSLWILISLESKVPEGLALPSARQAQIFGLWAAFGHTNLWGCLRPTLMLWATLWFGPPFAFGQPLGCLWATPPFAFGQP